MRNRGGEADGRAEPLLVLVFGLIGLLVIPFVWLFRQPGDIKINFMVPKASE